MWKLDTREGNTCTKLVFANDLLAYLWRRCQLEPESQEFIIMALQIICNLIVIVLMNYWTRRWKDLSRHQIFEAFVYGASGAYSLRSLDSKKYVSSHIFYWLQIFKVEFKTARMQLSWRNSWRGFWRKKADLASQSTYLGLLGRFKKEFEVSFAKSISQHQTLLVIGLLKRWRFSGKTSKTSKTKEALEMLFKSITDSSSLFRSGKRPSQVST